MIQMRNFVLNIKLISVDILSSVFVNEDKISYNNNIDFFCCLFTVTAGELIEFN